jgi:hypothetical protein
MGGPKALDKRRKGLRRLEPSQDAFTGTDIRFEEASDMRFHAALDGHHFDLSSHALAARFYKSQVLSLATLQSKGGQRMILYYSPKTRAFPVDGSTHRRNILTFAPRTEVVRFRVNVDKLSLGRDDEFRCPRHRESC